MLKMRESIPMLLLVVVSTNVFAEWTRVGTGSNGNITFYVDFATILKKGNKVKMWFVHDYKTPLDDDHIKFSSLLGQDEYDCEEETSRGITINTYSGNMVNGKVIGTEVYTFEESVPRLAAPGSMGETFFKIACGIK
jgi:hypothetical protein